MVLTVNLLLPSRGFFVSGFNNLSKHMKPTWENLKVGDFIECNEQALNSRVLQVKGDSFRMSLWGEVREPKDSWFKIDQAQRLGWRLVESSVCDKCKKPL